MPKKTQTRRHKVSRLVMEDKTRPFDDAVNKRSAGGWCKNAVIDQLDAVLQEHNAE